MPDAQTFDLSTTEVRKTVDALLDEAERLLPLVADVKRALGECDLTVARLRRNEDAIGQGPLNSVAAVQQSHKAMAKSIEDFGQHVLRLFDIRRELSVLHPAVVDAIADGVARQSAAKS